MNNPSGTLDIAEVIARREDIIDRTEAGKSFILSINGEPKVRLEPIPASTIADPGLGWHGAMREDAEILDQIVADTMRNRPIQGWRLGQEDFATLEAIAAETNRTLQEVLDEAIRLLISQWNHEQGKRPA